MKIILISGKAQHGKDTFALFLKEKFEKRAYKCRIIHFGDALKYVAKEYFSWDGTKSKEGREILQRVGTDIVRAQDEHFWTDFVARLAPMLGCDYLIIADWRFEEEYARLLEYFSYTDIITIRVNRYLYTKGSVFFAPYINPAMTPEQLAHRSEVELDNYATNYRIINIDIESFAESADELVKELTNL